jgi:pilus assembly protein CpaE
VIVASSLDPAMMIEAMRAGVTECVTDLTNGEFEAAVDRLAALRATPESGEVIAFLGAKGGIGTTTLAVNVAAALAKVKSASTLLIDFHLACGDAAIYLGAEPRFSVLDALDNTHRLDVAYFRGLIARSKSGVDLLASPDRPMAGQADASRVHTLIDFASHNYRYSVLDIPRSDASMLDALATVTKIVVLANQELATVRSASRLAPMLRQRYGKDKVIVVLSRSDRLADIGHEDIERAVGSPIKHVFPSDYRLALRALNRGRPLVLEAQNPLAQAVQAFALELVDGAAVPRAEPERQTRLFGRITGRR